MRISEKEKIIREFRKCLYDNDALLLWEYNVKYHHFWNVYRTPYKLLHKRDPLLYISGAFNWNSAKGGYEYWASLNIEWTIILRDK